MHVHGDKGVKPVIRRILEFWPYLTYRNLLNKKYSYLPNAAVVLPQRGQGVCV